MRLDVYLFNNNFTKSRKQAQDIIKDNAVCVNGKIVNKNNFEVNDNSEVKIVKSLCPYVSRAGYKLEGASKDFCLNFENKVVLDIGSSTGGFTDFCLKNGAKKVYAVDVGKGQLDSSLKNDGRVVSLENTDIRFLDKNSIEKVDFVVCDVSFISLTKISHKIAELTESGKECLVLIKPQFECGKEIASKYKGIIKDVNNLYQNIIDSVIENFKEVGLKNIGVNKSKILGGDGNTEFVAYFVKQ